MTIDWKATATEFGYDSAECLKGIRRPKVICTCNGCGKKKTIIIRVKSQLNNQTWLCPSCVALSRSDIISKTMKDKWANEEYRRKQIQKKKEAKYRTEQSKKSKERWNDSRYRTKLATGISKQNFIARAKTNHGAKFDYSNTKLNKWSDRIVITCTDCQNKISVMPQKHLIHGYCPRCGSSKGQRELAKYIESLGYKISINDKTAIPPYECDILCGHTAFEYHGIYWHSFDRPETTEERTKHQRKAIAAINKNIRLLQFFDFEWNEKQDLIKSMINNVFGLSTRIYARKTTVCDITNDEAATFFEHNHLSGYRTAKQNIGLRHNDKIVMAMSFSKSRDGYEIIRMASEQGTTIVGGASKMLSYFNNSPIYTFADLRYSVGNAYEKIGFKKIGVTKPGYFYTKQIGPKYLILSRQQCQKQKLPAFIEGFDPKLTEAENMFMAGFRRVWNAGHLHYRIN